MPKVTPDLEEITRFLERSSRAAPKVHRAGRCSPRRSGPPGSDPPKGETEFRLGLEGRRAAETVLENPWVSRRVLLDRPILIWQRPLLDIVEFSSNIESFNSEARIKFNAGQGAQSLSVVFYFLWTNDTAQSAVIETDSQLVVTGACSVRGDSGVFSGYKSSLLAMGSLWLIRNSGWGTDSHTFVPHGGQDANAIIVDLEVQGGGLFQGSSYDSESFDFQPFELRHGPLLVPANASVIFGVLLYVFYSVEGDTIEDLAELSFFAGDSALRCPFVGLTVMTPN
jgi:hypothetical protein